MMGFRFSSRAARGIVRGVLDVLDQKVAAVTRRWCALALALALALSAPLVSPPAAAASPGGFELQSFGPSAAGDRFYTVPGGDVAGDGVVSARLLAAYAYKPLLQVAVTDQLLLDAAASVAIDRRWLIALHVPVFPVQDGTADGASLGDVHLGGRTRLLAVDGLALASELRVWLPTGSPAHLTGDESLRTSVHLAASGHVSSFVYAASAGYLARARRTRGAAEVGPSIPVSAGVAVVLLGDRLQVGPEVSALPVIGAASTLAAPASLLVTAKYRIGDLVLGLGAGPGLSHSPGAAPHVALGVAWEPRDTPAPAPADDTRTASETPPPTAKPEAPPPSPAATPATAPTPPAPALPTPAPTPPAPAPPTPAPAPALSDEESRQEARRLFKLAVAAYDEGRYAEAAETFAAAQALRPHPVVLRNLAQSELVSHRFAEACAHFRQWKAEVKNPSSADLAQADAGIMVACP